MLCLIMRPSISAGDASEWTCCDAGDVSLPADGLLEGQRSRFQTDFTGMYCI